MDFTVEGSAATPATAISLAEAGLKEREHLQECVLQYPRVLGDDVKIVAFEFGRWSGTGSSVERDRLDILGLDTEGQLVVVELKRDKAPETVDMQALEYAALVSRFTREDLDHVHARHLDELPPDPNGLIVRDATPRYVHAQVSDSADVAALIDLVRVAYDGNN